MINGYVNAPQEIFDIPYDEFIAGKEIKKGDELFNKVYEYVMSCAHKLPVLSGTFLVRDDDGSVVGEVTFSVVGTFFSTPSSENVVVTFITGGSNFTFEALPDKITIKT